MTAVDTNIVVRLLTADDAKQTRAAERLFASDQIWIGKTVLLETAWVLRSLYGFNEDLIHSAFRKLFGLKNVRVEDRRSVEAALSLNGHGMDFADALHLTSRPLGATFASFDRAPAN